MILLGNAILDAKRCNPFSFLRSSIPVKHSQLSPSQSQSTKLSSTASCSSICRMAFTGHDQLGGLR